MEIAAEGENGLEAVQLCRQFRPDAVFLDIQMPGMNGLEAAEQILRLENPPAVIFQTAYDEFAIRAFEVRAVDYILKPVSGARLAAALERIREKRDTRVSAEDILSLLKTLGPAAGSAAADDSCADTALDILPVYSGDTIIPLRKDEIIFAEARGKTVRIVSRKGDFSYSGAFGEVEEKLSGPDFIQCHRSYVVNISFVERIDLWVNNTYMLGLRGVDERIPVSRGRMADFKRRMNI